MLADVNARELKRMYDLEGPKRTCKMIREGLNEGHLRPEDFSLRALAEALVPDGREWVQSMDPRHAGSSILEAGEAVDSTAFSNITGQIVYSRLMEEFTNEAFVFSSLIPSTPTRLSGEKIAGMAAVGDKTEIVREGMPYQHAGFGEDFTETPATDKRGLIIPVTREAIFFDRTGLVLRQAGEVGQSLGLNKEKRATDLVIGATNNFKWKGTSYNTYQTSAPWINDHVNVLEDHTDIDNAEQLFANILDPNTNEPVLVNPDLLIVPPKLQSKARRIVNSTEVRETTNTNTQTLSPNPVSPYSIVVSRYLTVRDTADTWYLGDPRRAFTYMENWPITVTQAPQNSEAEFTQDIVMRFKASERGNYAVMQPRAMVRNNPS